jgi:hypothetical protein
MSFLERAAQAKVDRAAKDRANAVRRAKDDPGVLRHAGPDVTGDLATMLEVPLDPCLSSCCLSLGCGSCRVGSVLIDGCLGR